jgi:trehalose 6-phosphate phosphatase
MSSRVIEDCHGAGRRGHARLTLRHGGRVGVSPGNLHGRAAAWEVVEGFLERAARASARALLLDYDGTLAPLQTRRQELVPYPGVADVLSRLVASGGTRVAIISGRALEDLKTSLSWLEPRPELWGSHGLERLTRGGLYATFAEAPADRHFIDDVWGWVCLKGWESLFERKPFGFALHSRGVAPEEFALVRNAVCDRWRLAARETGLEVVGFDGGLEFRPAGHHKGQVVEAILEEMGSEAAVAYLGDDATDEDAFAALSGRGLSVLVRVVPRPTAAAVCLRPPEDLLRFLNAWERQAGPGRHGDPSVGARGK